eukprot:4999375-Amphidinium_carterae.1
MRGSSLAHQGFARTVQGLESNRPASRKPSPDTIPVRDQDANKYVLLLCNNSPSSPAVFRFKANSFFAKQTQKETHIRDATQDNLIQLLL